MTDTMTDPDCSICRTIPRACTGGRFGDGSLQKAGAKLVPPTPLPELRDNLTSVHRCPACDASYRYEYSSETDDLDVFVTETLVRLEAMDALGLAAVQSRRETLTTAWYTALGHPAPWVRIDAARNLVTFARAECRWTTILEMLAHTDPIVRQESIRVLCEAVALPLDTPAELIVALREASSDRRSGVFELAGYALARWDFVHSAVEDLLSNDLTRRDRWRPPLAGYLVLLADDALARLVPLLVDPDAVLTKALCRGLSDLAHDRGLGPITCSALVALFAGDSLAGVTAAIRILTLQPTPLDTAAFACLTRWIDDERTHASAIEFVRHQRRNGAQVGDLGAALDARRPRS